MSKAEGGDSLHVIDIEKDLAVCEAIPEGEIQFNEYEDGRYEIAIKGTKNWLGDYVATCWKDDFIPFVIMAHQALPAYIRRVQVLEAIIARAKEYEEEECIDHSDWECLDPTITCVQCCIKRAEQELANV